MGTPQASFRHRRCVSELNSAYAASASSELAVDTFQTVLPGAWTWARDDFLNKPVEADRPRGSKIAAGPGLEKPSKGSLPPAPGRAGLLPTTRPGHLHPISATVLCDIKRSVRLSGQALEVGVGFRTRGDAE